MTHVQGPLGGPRPFAQRRAVVFARIDIAGPAGVLPRPFARVEEE